MKLKTVRGGSAPRDDTLLEGQPSIGCEPDEAGRRVPLGGKDSGTSKSRHSDPVVGHPVINVEAVWRTEIGAAVDGGGKHDVGDGPQPFLR